MYKVIVIGEDGEERVTENVLDYNLIDVSLVQKIAKDDFETGLTKDEIEDLESDLSDWEELPDVYQLQGLIEDIINDRE